VRNPSRYARRERTEAPLTPTLPPPRRFVQESIYESCLVSTRKTVHKNIARHLELSKADQLPKFYGQIGNHYFAADEWRSASLYLQLSAEVSEKNEMPKTVITELLRWFGIREKLGLSDGDPGVNGRYSTAKMEEGVVCAMMARAYEKLTKYVPSKKNPNQNLHPSSPLMNAGSTMPTSTRRAQ
jgi:hypothetical protein